MSKGGGKSCCCATGRRGAPAGCSPLADSGASPVKQRDPIGSPPRLASQSSIAQLNHSIETRPASDGMNQNFRQLCSSPSASNFALLPAELLHTKKIQRCFSDCLSLEFLVHYSSKEEGKKCPRTVGGFSFSIYPPNLWLAQFIKAGVVGGPAPCFPSPRHAAGELLGAAPQLKAPSRDDSEDNVICSTCWKNSNKAPPKKNTCRGALSFAPMDSNERSADATGDY